MRRDAVWSKRTDWDAVIGDALDFTLPMRAAGRRNSGQQINDKLFDMTAPMGAVNFAGNLQKDLFPTGQPPFTIESGPMLSAAIGKDEVKKFDLELDNISKIMFPFFQQGDWDTATHETCLDLVTGTGALLPIKGTAQNPVIFASIPFDNIAVATDAWGRVNFVSWWQKFDRGALLEAFPNGKFTSDEKDAAKNKPYEEIEVYQDFWADPQGQGWHFCASIKNSDVKIVEERTRTQPIAVPRYYRLNSQAYGFGPALVALPSIKTVNKAQELALRSAAIQMLGIWGYRAGGTFNPDTIRQGPGEFWPMQFTGGMMGPDVQRLDPATGRLDIAQMVIGNMQDDIKKAMFDTRLPDYQGTPRAASEIAARLQQRAEVHIGAFGRLVQEIMPVIVPRVAEILYDFGFLNVPVSIDGLLMAVKVRSPMAAALNAERLSSIAQYFEMIQHMAGPERVEEFANIDTALDLMAEGMQVDKSIVPTPDQRQAALQKRAQEQEAALMAQAAEAGAQQLPGMLAQEAMKEESA